jgi:NTP pyrophosphatase (non-canonical NTP hydrolase)
MMIYLSKNGGEPSVPLSSLFEAQSAYQKKVTGLDTPVDSLTNYSYHVQAMVEEMGELMKADKRWKTHRNVVYDPLNKLEEISDVIITIINIALYSGFNYQEVGQAVLEKIEENELKLKMARHKEVVESEGLGEKDWATDL